MHTPKAWTLTQLKFANEICFPSDFERLWIKYSPEEYRTWWVVLLMDFKQAKGFLAWISMYSRRDLDGWMGAVIDNMIAELVGDYK